MRKRNAVGRAPAVNGIVPSRRGIHVVGEIAKGTQFGKIVARIARPHPIRVPTINAVGQIAGSHFGSGWCGFPTVEGIPFDFGLLSHLAVKFGLALMDRWPELSFRLTKQTAVKEAKDSYTNDHITHEHLSKNY
jgi:hypothetical protein